MCRNTAERKGEFARCSERHYILGVRARKTFFSGFEGSQAVHVRPSGGGTFEVKEGNVTLSDPGGAVG
jgi:hypothetical protein